MKRLIFAILFVLGCAAPAFASSYSFTYDCGTTGGGNTGTIQCDEDYDNDIYCNDSVEISSRLSPSVCSNYNDGVHQFLGWDYYGTFIPAHDTSMMLSRVDGGNLVAVWATFTCGTASGTPNNMSNGISWDEEDGYSPVSGIQQPVGCTAPAGTYMVGWGFSGYGSVILLENENISSFLNQTLVPMYVTFTCGTASGTPSFSGSPLPYYDSDGRIYSITTPGGCTTSNAVGFLGWQIDSTGDMVWLDPDSGEGMDINNIIGETLVAKWATFSCGTASGTPSVNQPFGFSSSGDINNVVNFDANDIGCTPNSGESFLGWKTNGADDIIEAYNNTLDDVNGQTLIAQWGRDSYTVTLNCGVGTGNPGTVTATRRENGRYAYFVPAVRGDGFVNMPCERDGYFLMGFSETGSLSDININTINTCEIVPMLPYSEGITYNYPYNTDKTLTAVWKKNDTVTYDCGDGTGNVVPTGIRWGTCMNVVNINNSENCYWDDELGEDICSGACSYPGYRFTGWRVNGTNDFISANAACHYEDGGGCYGYPEGWAYAGGDKPVWPYDGDKTFTAQWEEIRQYTVTYSCGDGTGTPPGSQTVDEYVWFQPTWSPNCSKSGYRFAGWSVSDSNDVFRPEGGGQNCYWDEELEDDVCTGPNVIDGIDWNYGESKTLTAIYDEIYTVSFSCGSGTGTPPASITTYHGGSFRMPQLTCSRSNYVFAGWQIDGDTYWPNNSYTYNGNSNTTVVAQWTPAYTVTYECGAGTTGNPPASETVGYELSFRPPYPSCAKAGEYFTGWLVSGDGDIIKNGESITWEYNENKTLTAMFSNGKFAMTLDNIWGYETISFDINASGTFTVDWGDGSAIETYNSVDTVTPTHTYEDNGPFTVILDGAATGGYDNGGVLKMNCSDNWNMSYKLRGISGSLGAIFGTINGVNPSFEDAFNGCDYLSGGIPATLFSGISGAPVESMFKNTFNNTSVSGSIPATLFSGISGAPADYMFSGTFSNCVNLTGSIPATLFSGISGAPATGMFQNTFQSADNLTGSIPATLFSGISGVPADYMFAYTFDASGVSGPIPATLFSGISGAPAEGMFENTFSWATGLNGPIPAALFSGISGAPASRMFLQTFSWATGLSGPIPAALFSGISGAPADYMFSGTFEGSGVSGSIPATLFSGISGAPAESMFHQTFYGCSSLTGSIPATLFGTLNGPSADYMFRETFYDVANLNGYIPAELFENIEDDSAESSFDSMFYGTQLMTSCPCGTQSVEMQWGDDTIDGRAICEDAPAGSTLYWDTGNGTVCGSICPSQNFSEVHIGSNIVLPLAGTRLTTRTINVKYGDDTCYLPLATGAQSNTLNLNVEDTIYHAIIPTTTPPAGE